MTWDRLRTDIEETDQQWAFWRALLPEMLFRWLSSDWDTRKKEHFDRREEIKRVYRSGIEDTRSIVSELIDKTKNLIETKTPDSSTLNDLGEDIQNEGKPRLSALRNLEEKYLTKEEIQQIEEIEHKINRARKAIIQKQDLSDFHRTIRPIRKKLKNIKQDQRFLTSSERKKLKNQLRSSYEKLQSINNQYDQKDEEWLSDEMKRMTQKFNQTNKLLGTFNENFASQRIKQLPDLLPDLPEDELPNQQQREAIVKNDHHNLVIAGAGTGKTKTLICRIAYLVKKPDPVPPEKILAITYTKNAAAEMEKRLRHQFDITDVEVRTLHSLGMNILKNNINFDGVFNKSDLRDLISETLNQWKNDRKGKMKTYLEGFLRHFQDELPDREDFEDQRTYFEHMRQKKYTTLKGEKVKSLAEKQVADFLFQHQVAYKYEAPARWARTGKDHRSYRPDFFLPDYDVYVEHWGIGSNGEVPEHWNKSTDEYKDEIKWKRKQFNRTERYNLVEITRWEMTADQFEQTLRKRLKKQGVNLNRFSFEELVNQVYDRNEIRSIIHDLFKQFIENARQSGLSGTNPDYGIRNKPLKAYYFDQCAKRLFSKYEQQRQRHNEIDFSQMIHGAIEQLQSKSDRFADRFEHVLVDEFQDITPHQRELIDLLFDPKDGNRLFCVGDDWQSIYGFRGADVRTILQFDDHFPEPEVTRLEESFRCPPKVVKAGNDLISQNESQREKTVRSRNQTAGKPRVHRIKTEDKEKYLYHANRLAVELILEHLNNGAPEELMVLSRFNHHLKSLQKHLKLHDIKYNDDRLDSGGTLQLSTIHSAKGTEADNVILLHAIEGTYGLPSQIDDSLLLNPVLAGTSNKIAEERRLFYVTLTRTKGSIELITQQENESRFLNEIDEHSSSGRQISVSEEGDQTTLREAQVVQIKDDTHRKIKQKGYLKDSGGIKKRFLIWNDTAQPPLSKGATYNLENLKVDYYQGNKNLVITEKTEVDQISQADHGEQEMRLF